MPAPSPALPDHPEPAEPALQALAGPANTAEPPSAGGCAAPPASATCRDAAPPPLRCCLLSGGESRRMGRDKALLSHPEGGTWLERTLRLLATLEAPITLLSRHPAHLELARDLGTGGAAGGIPALTALAEPPPWQGPLPALARLMEHHPDERLLLCPVDMPWLEAACLRTLLAADAAAESSDAILLAHDGERLQPLLGIYPATPARRRRLTTCLAAGELGLQRWLAGEHWRPLRLEARMLRNANRPEDWPVGL